MSRPELDMLWLSALAVCARCDKSNTLRRLACANCSAPLAWECTSCTTMNLLNVASCCACGVGELMLRDRSPRAFVGCRCFWLTRCLSRGLQAGRAASLREKIYHPKRSPSRVRVWALVVSFCVVAPAKFWRGWFFLF
jgi:hypothetical protein